LAAPITPKIPASSGTSRDTVMASKRSAGRTNPVTILLARRAVAFAKGGGREKCSEAIVGAIAAAGAKSTRQADRFEPDFWPVAGFTNF
jgi:hypothetical protein